MRSLAHESRKATSSFAADISWGSACFGFYDWGLDEDLGGQRYVRWTEGAESWGEGKGETAQDGLDWGVFFSW